MKDRDGAGDMLESALIGRKMHGFEVMVVILVCGFPFSVTFSVRLLQNAKPARQFCREFR